MVSNKVVIFDLWQTLADSPVRPSSILGLLPNKNISREVFLKMLFQSAIFLENKDFSLSMKEFLASVQCSDEKLSKRFCFCGNKWHRPLILSMGRKI